MWLTWLYAVTMWEHILAAHPGAFSVLGDPCCILYASETHLFAILSNLIHPSLLRPSPSSLPMHAWGGQLVMLAFLVAFLAVNFVCGLKNKITYLLTYVPLHCYPWKSVLTHSCNMTKIMQSTLLDSLEHGLVKRQSIINFLVSISVPTCDSFNFPQKNHLKNS